MRETGRKALFFMVALPVVLRAALRLWRLERRSTLDDLVERLRSVKPFRLRYLRNPAWLAGAIDRLPSPALSIRSDGTCWRRSLLLLDLLSRCGEDPTLHLGLTEATGRRHVHAWVTVDGRPVESTMARREIWSG